MNDYTELKRLAEAAVGKTYSSGEKFFFSAEATPEQVLALIAENEELGRYLCTCRDCGGEGALHTGDWHSYSPMEPPEPVMEKCGECDGTGLLGEVQDLYQVITERDLLKAENEQLRDSHEKVCTNYNQVSYASEERGKQIDQLRAEIAGLKTGYEAYERVNAELKTEVEALRKDQPSAEVIWCACGDGYAANSYGAGFMDANSGVCWNCDAAMGRGEQP